MGDPSGLGDRTEPIVVHDGRRVLYANGACLSLFGVGSTGSLIGASLLDRVAERHREALIDQFERIDSGETATIGASIEIETETETEAGASVAKTRRVVALSEPLEWDGDERIQTVFFGIDGPLPEHLTGATLESSPVGISIADAARDDEPLVYVNDEFLELTGYDRNEVLGRNCRFLQGPDTREEPVAELRAAIDAAEAITVDLRNYRKDGSAFWNRLTVTPIENEEGEATHFLGYQEDVSEEKLAERERAQFRSQAEAAEESVFVTDADGVIEYVNPTFERTTGYDAAEMIGETPRLIRADGQDDTFYEDLRGTIGAGDVWESETTNRRKSGELYRSTQKVIPVTDPDGAVTHFVSIEEDVTDERFTEQVLYVMDRVLRHNVRNSTQAIQGFADLLETELDAPEHRGAVRTIQEHAEKLERLSDRTRSIRELFARRDAQPSLSVGAIEGIVRSRRETHPEATIELMLRVDRETEIKNGSLLRLALDEALENAVLHSDRERPRVSVTVGRRRADSGVRIEIADDGPGIPDDQWDVITSGQETPLRHSTGIGLWLIHWTATALGGTLDRKRNEPRGTRLVLAVPTGTDGRTKR